MCFQQLNCLTYMLETEFRIGTVRRYNTKQRLPTAQAFWHSWSACVSLLVAGHCAVRGWSLSLYINNKQEACQVIYTE